MSWSSSVFCFLYHNTLLFPGNLCSSWLFHSTPYHTDSWTPVTIFNWVTKVLGVVFVLCYTLLCDWSKKKGRWKHEITDLQNWVQLRHFFPEGISKNINLQFQIFKSSQFPAFLLCFKHFNFHFTALQKVLYMYVNLKSSHGWYQHIRIISHESIFNSQKWLRCNFPPIISIYHPAKGKENTQTYQVEFVKLIAHQILITTLCFNN